VGTIQSFLQKKKKKNQNDDRWSKTPFVKRGSGAGPGSHMADLNSGVADLRSCVVILCESMLGHLEFEPSKLNRERSPKNMQISRHGFQIIGYTETDLAFAEI
jgi:hypothetical protein